MQIRRAEAADEEALASIRRRAILALAVPAMSREQAERWATRGAADRVARAMREHDVWVAVEGAAIGWVEVDRDRVAALYVSPSCSRRGVGSVLLTFAETSIRSSGYTTARLRPHCGVLTPPHGFSNGRRNSMDFDSDVIRESIEPHQMMRYIGNLDRRLA